MNKRIDRMKKCALTPVAILLFAAVASAQNYYVLNLGVLPGQTDSLPRVSMPAERWSELPAIVPSSSRSLAR